MPHLPRRQLVVLGLGLTVLAQPLAAQETVRVRGAIEKKDGAAYIVKTRDGEMTNANVETMVTGVDGHTLTMKYKDGEKKLVVTPQTVVVTFAPGDAAEIGPGTKVFISVAQKQADGSVKAPRITYGKDGLTPPM